MPIILILTYLKKLFLREIYRFIAVEMFHYLV
jgi:hypothetical protein